MGCQGTFRKLKADGYTASAALVFLFLKDEASCADDLRVACAPRYVAEELDFSEKVVRTAFKKLAAGGLIKLETKARGYTMASILWGAEKGAVKGAEKTSIKQPVLNVEGAEKGAVKGATGVTAVKTFSSAVGVSVSPAVVESELKIPAAKKPAAVSAQSEAEKREGKAAGYAKLCAHITDTWTVKKRGLPPRWSKDCWVNLWAQTSRFSCAQIGVLWDAYLQSNDPFIQGQGYSLMWFANRSIDALTDVVIDYKRRAEKYDELWLGIKPFKRETEKPRGAEKLRKLEPIMPTRAQTIKPAAPVKEPTDQEMHQQTVDALYHGRCRTKGCEWHDKPAAPAAQPALVAAGAQSDVKRQSPF